MSKQAQLPPRVPLKKKNTAPQESNLQSSVAEERPKLLDLLSELDPNVTGITGDSLTLSKSLMSLPDKDELTDVESPETSESDDGVESSCNYGPNSPKRKSKSNFSEDEIVSALPKYVVQNPLKHFDGHVTVSGVPQSKSFGNGCASADASPYEPGSIDSQLAGKRSRIRKLQYINNLELTTQNLQNLNSRLNGQLGYLYQQNAALIVENDSLKQQLQVMQQERFIADGQYVALKEELGRLKARVTPAKGKVPNWAHPMHATKFNRPDSYSLWGDTAELDIGKLNLK